MASYRIPLSQIKAKNKAIGHHFFERATSKYFGSSYPKDAKVRGNYAYFVTSEIDPAGVKRYSIREADLKTGEVRTAEGTEFHAYKTDAEAKKIMNEKFFKEEITEEKIKPLTFEQSKRLFEILRNETSLNGKEIMDLSRNLKEKKLIKRGY